MYCLVPEKSLRLVYGTFYLAIGESFYETFNFAIYFEPQNIEQGIMNVEVKYSIILMI